MIENVSVENVRANALGFAGRLGCLVGGSLVQISIRQVDEGMNTVATPDPIPFLKLRQLEKLAADGFDPNLRALHMFETTTGPVEFISLVNLFEEFVNLGLELRGIGDV